MEEGWWKMDDGWCRAMRDDQIFSIREY